MDRKLLKYMAILFAFVIRPSILHLFKKAALKAFISFLLQVNNFK